MTFKIFAKASFAALLLFLFVAVWNTLDSLPAVNFKTKFAQIVPTGKVAFKLGSHNLAIATGAYKGIILDTWNGRS